MVKLLVLSTQTTCYSLNLRNVLLHFNIVTMFSKFQCNLLQTERLHVFSRCKHRLFYWESSHMETNLSNAIMCTHNGTVWFSVRISALFFFPSFVQTQKLSIRSWKIYLLTTKGSTFLSPSRSLRCPETILVSLASCNRRRHRMDLREYPLPLSAWLRAAVVFVPRRSPLHSSLVRV